ncbi:hypothetical protein D3C73_894160 [compost metagenome]
MMVAEKESDQLSFFSEITETDFKQTKSYLSKYRKLKLDIEDYEKKNPNVTSKGLEEAKSHVGALERATALIIDPDVRRIIDHRYLKGNRHKSVVMYFRSIMSESTIDRKIEEGIGSIASSLKLWAEFTR